MATESMRRAAARLALTALGYLALAVLFTWPLGPRLLPPADAGHIPAHGIREATPALNIWAMATVVHRLGTAPLRLFDGNAFYPFEDTLAFSEHLFVPALMASPFYAASGNWVFANGALTLLTLALAGLGMHRLARALGLSEAAAALAGGLYAFHTWNVNELVRIQVLSNEWFPWLLLALLRYFQGPTIRRAALASLAFAAQGLSCMYWALYAPFVLAACVLFLWRRSGAPLRVLARLAAALAPAALLVALFFVPYLRTAERHAFAREEPQALELTRYFDVLPNNLLYESALGTAGPNQNAAHFLGFVALALFVAGLWRGEGRPHLEGWRPLLAGLAAAGFLLSLGPDIEAFGRRLGPGPYAALYRWVPGFRNVRYPERFALVSMLGFAPLAAAGLDRLRPRLGRLLTPALVGLALVEHLAIPQQLDALPAARRIPDVYRWLAGRPDVRVVAEWPASHHRLERFDALPMYCSTAHWKRTVEGFTGYFPPTYNFAKWRLFHFPAGRSVRFLSRLGVDTVIVRPDPQTGEVPVPEFARVENAFADGARIVRLEAAPAPDFAPPSEDTTLVPVETAGCQIQGSAPGARSAIDGDPSTVWVTPDAQDKGDFLRIAFPAPVEVARVSVAVPPPYEFPMRLRLVGLEPSGEWREIPYDVDAAYDRLFAFLLHRPRAASLDVDIAPQLLAAIRLRIAETDPFWMPWRVSEVRVYRRR